MKRIALRAVGAAAVLLLCCTGSGMATRYPDDNQSFDVIARGRYLTVMGDCTACHTAEGGKPFAGGRVIPTPFGNMVSPNITPDAETGIGGWSDAEFYNAMHNGQMAGGRLYPAMPYTYYTRMTRGDVMAIRAYLNTVQPVHNDVVSNTLPFPFNLRAPAMTVWDWLNFTRGTWKSDPKHSAAWNRGAYIVEGPGHCGACHTPKNLIGGDTNSRALQGEPLQGWFAPDITGAARVGLANWSNDDIVEYLKTGANRFTDASGPMADEVHDSSSHWSLADLQAVATYLKSLKGKAEAAAQPLAADDPRMQAGRAIFVDQCAACHTMDGKGIQRLFPQLAGSPFVQSPQPTSLLQVVLNGTRATRTQYQPTGPEMPSFAWKLTNAQVADVVTYVRNAWGNAAPPVSDSQVQSARKAPGG